MRIWIKIALIMAIIAPITVSAIGPDIPIKGIICWNKNSEPDLAGYKYYINTVSGVPTETIDLGLITTAPSGCSIGKVGIVKDQTGKADGQYYAGVSAYDSSNNISPYSEFAFSLNSVAPASPVGLVIK